MKISLAQSAHKKAVSVLMARAANVTAKEFSKIRETYIDAVGALKTAQDDLHVHKKQHVSAKPDG